MLPAVATLAHHAEHLLLLTVLVWAIKFQVSAVPVLDILNAPAVELSSDIYDAMTISSTAVEMLTLVLVVLVVVWLRKVATKDKAIYRLSFSLHSRKCWQLIPLWRLLSLAML